MSVVRTDKYNSSSDSFYPEDPGYTPHVGLYEGELELTEEYLKFWGKFLFKRRSGAGTLLLLGSRNQAMMSDGPVIHTRL